MAHPSDHLPPHSKFRTPAFASSSSSAASSPPPSPSPSSDSLPTHPPPTTTSTTNSQAFDAPHHLHHSSTIRGAAAAARPNADVEPAHLPSHFYPHAPHHHHHHHHPHPHYPHPHHQNELRLPISRHHESHLKMASAHSMNNSNETESPDASAKGILDQTLRSYVHAGVVSPPSAPSLYRASVHGAREQPPSFLHPPEASNRFFPADSSHPLKGGFPLADRAISHSLSIRDEGSNGISSRGSLNNDIGGFLASERMPYPLSNQEDSSPNCISMSAPASNDPDQNARFIALSHSHSHSHSRFKPNSSISPHIDHQHHHPPSFPLTRNPFISSSVLMDSGHELVHGASTIGLQRHGSSSLAGFLARTNNEGSSSGNTSDDGSYERHGPPPVAAAATHQHIKETSPFFEGYTWDEAGNVMTGSANSAAIGAADGAAAYNRKAFRDSDKYYTGHTPVDSQKGNSLEHGALANHFALGTATSPESIYFTDRLSTDSIPCRIRAKRGCATHPRSIAERVRRTKISERMKKLQELVPNMDKHTNTAEMLDEAVEYVKGLQHQVKELTEAQAKCSCSYNNTGKDQ